MTVKYREIKRKANVGERIRIVNAITATNAYVFGDEMAVRTRRDHTPNGVYTYEQPVFVYDTEYVVLEPVAPAPPKQLDFPDELTQSLALFVRENASAIRKYLDQIETKTPPKPATLTRAEVIAKAKEDVAELFRIHWGFDVRFRVNRPKRAVACDVLRDGKRHSSASAKAAPGDVFHAEIGKAIALRRALGLTVPDEYINAPKPDGPRVGAVVIYDHLREHGTEYVVTDVPYTPNNLRIIRDEDDGIIGDLAQGRSLERAIIIDDTDVDYSADSEGSAA